MERKTSRFFVNVLRISVVKNLSTIFLLGVILFVPSLASATNNDPFRSGREAVSPKPSVGVAQSSGAMTYSYPLTIPPGRNGMQSDLSFTYSSADKRQDSVFGYGWTLNLPYIERVNKLGTNNLYNQDADHTFFTSSLSGELLPVKNTTPQGGSFLGIALDAITLPLIDTLSSEAPMSDSMSAPTAIEAPLPESLVSDQRVTDTTARSFHDFFDTFLPVKAFHPNEEAEYARQRVEAAKDAKVAIPGFVIAEKKKPSFIHRFNPALLSETSSHPLKDYMENESPSTRASIKGEALASIGSLSKTHRDKYAIAIDSMDPIDGGVELFARVWDKNDKQIGFGKDGTVDVERFRIFNPPILVEDPKGDIVHQWANIETGEKFERHFREDPKEALLQSLERTIDAKKEKFDSTAIIHGKEGHTTSTFYSGTDDGWAKSNSTVWSTVRTGSGELGNTTDANIADFRLSDWYSDITLYRYHGAFNTSALGTATISSASLNVYFSSLLVGNLTSHNGWQVSKSALTGADAATRWDSYTNALDGVPYSSETRLGTTTGYVQFALNAQGVSAINKTGTTSMGIIPYWDMVNTDPNQTGGVKNDNGTIVMADTAGTTNDPMLVVESTGGSGSGVATSTLQDLNYTYDAVGNIMQIIDRSGTNSKGTTTYQYDPLLRLTRASSTGAVTDWLQTYTYNDIGNLLTKSDVGSYTYAGTGFANPHAPTQVGSTNYSYDNAGNVTSAGAQAFSWDPWNRMTDVSNSGTSTHYAYDSNGLRVQQDINRGSGTTSTRYFGKTFEVTGATTTLYIFLPNGELLATVEGNGSATSTYIAHTDHLGSVQVMSDKNGSSTQVSSYYPFGSKRLNELPSNGFVEKRGFIQQYEDTAVQLSYLQQRYYDATRGQFMSQDPIFAGDPNRQNLGNPQSLNSYNYAENNPIIKSDPNGQFATLPLAMVGAGIGGIGGFAAQYVSNVNADLEQGQGWRSLYGDVSWEKTERYGSSMSMGAIAGFATGACVGLCSGAVAVAVGGGGAFSGSMLKDSTDYLFDKYAFGKTNTVFDVKRSVVNGIVNTGVSVATMGLVKTVPQVRGVDISTFGQAALTGAHTQAKLANEAILQSLTSILNSLKSIVAQLGTKPTK